VKIEDSEQAVTMVMRREGELQGDLLMTWAEMPRSPGHVFYDRLQELLSEAGFDAFVEEMRLTDFDHSQRYLNHFKMVPVMILKCKYCGAPVPSEKRDCQACGEDNGAPNVRLAESEAERRALARRLRDAETSTRARKCRDVLERFGVAVLSSRAVMARSLAVVQDLIEAGRTYTSYQRQLASGARVAEDNAWDKTRTQVESALFPNFQQDIVFASLSLDSRGMSGYGAYVMILKEPLIARRASVFEANPYDLVEKLGWLLNKPIPPGYRAILE